MPSSLATVIGWIEKSILNKENQQLVHLFVEFMQKTDTSQKYQRGNLIVVIQFAKHLGLNKRLSEIERKEDIIHFLNSLRKDAAVDPDKKWIRTWNDYLQRISISCVGFITIHRRQYSEWLTPQFARIKGKRQAGSVHM